MTPQPRQSRVEWRVIEGDCREALLNLPAQSVQCCVTSPPYFGLRDYGHDGQIGLEPTPDEFVEALVGVFREVRRVLRDDGTVWLNLGDSFHGGGYSNHRINGDEWLGAHGGDRRRSRQQDRINANPGLKPKDLIGIPWMVAFALRADGWYLRSDIIWAKPNPMPESVTDRPTKAHEYLFLLSKQPRYFYDADAIRETFDKPIPEDGPESGIYAVGSGRQDGGKHVGGGFLTGQTGRNRRSVWEVATQPFPGAHFATFPPKLIEPCILAGTAPKACGVCGAPWRRVVERTPMVVRPSPKRADWQATDDHARTQTGGTMVEPPTARTVGWESGCDHEDDTGHCVVLDPFNGAGTTGLVALRHDRSYIGIELNPAYAEMARWRLRDDAPLLNVTSEAA